MKLLVLCVALFFLAGCETIGTTQTVPYAIPVKCKQFEPPRPSMPTESLSVSDPLDKKIQALTAEIETREGYEVELRAALRACI